MNKVGNLSLANLTRKPGRTAALLGLSILLSGFLFGGSILIRSLQRGLDSLSDRLGADVIVVPKDAEEGLEGVLLQGVPGYFYMDKEIVTKLATADGVEKVSAQYYLATADSGCCSIPVQIIGFDSATDFTISPWVKKRYQKDLNTMDVLIGSNIMANDDQTLRFYGQTCHVAARLEHTGTSLDSAVYANGDTVHVLLDSAVDTGFVHLEQNDPEKLISSVLIKTADGVDVSKLVSDIEKQFPDVRAVQTTGMIRGTTSSLTELSGMIKGQLVCTGVLVLLIMAVAYMMIANERKKEFAVLRTIGFSGKQLAGLVCKESLILGTIGGFLGIGIASLILFPFESFYKQKSGLPFLTPEGAEVFLWAVAVLILSAFAGTLTGGIAAYKASKTDTAYILREGN